MLLANILFLLLSVASLPSGFEQALWGMTVADLEKITDLHKATPGSEYQYSEHMETNPDVYVSVQADRRVEYYFFRQRLYKIFVVYKRAYSNEADIDTHYGTLIKQQTDMFGNPHQSFQETVFGLNIKHTLWMSDDSILDVRYGAGFVYEVRIDRKAAAAKKLLQQFRRSI